MFNPILKSFFILLLDLDFKDTLKSSYIKDWYCKKKKSGGAVPKKPIVSSGIKIDI